MRKLVLLIAGFIMIAFSATTVSAAVEYEVEKGDNLWTIARDNDTTVKHLMHINDLHSTTIHPKQILKVEKEEAEYYEVQKGDTLIDISKELGEDVNVSDLKDWNQLPSDLIIVGQQLIINGESLIEKKEEIIVESEEVDTTEAAVTVVEEETKKEEEAEEEEESEKEETVVQTTKLEGRTLTVEATAYTAYCAGCSGVTATGIDLRANPNMKLIAVDPNVIPLGTKVYVEGYGYAVAGDTGGAIRGNKIDIHVPTKAEAYQWGRRTVNVTIVE